MDYILELTKEQLDFINDRCFNKMAHLEDLNLDDTPCYRIAQEILHKIYLLRKERGEIQNYKK